LVITVPRMGNTCLAVKALFDGLRIPYIIPEKNNKLTLQQGSFLSPEEICLPFKVMMGNYIESIKRGADTILITGSCGPCRFGEYCELQMKLLKKLGLNINMIVVDSPSDIGKNVLWGRIKSISQTSALNKAAKLNALRHAFSILSLADGIDAKAHLYAGYETNKGDCKRLIKQCESEAYKYSDPAATQRALESYYKMLDGIPLDKTKKPLKIALIGEIYSMIEPFSNLYIEERLMDYGVSSARMITPSWWLKDLALKPFKLNSRNVRLASNGYLPVGVGGHAKESIAHAVISKRNKFDGAIQIFPLGCMPEVVTKSVLPTLQKDLDFPVMSLVIDEMTGDAGYVTRIEAFIDMLESKRKKERVVG
jgi:predicted nucleotide-binding protein (sugar kinase/HSP70/actin superfamily)